MCSVDQNSSSLSLKYLGSSVSLEYLSLVWIGTMQSEIGNTVDRKRESATMEVHWCCSPWKNKTHNTHLSLQRPQVYWRVAADHDPTKPPPLHLYYNNSYYTPGSRQDMLKMTIYLCLFIWHWIYSNKFFWFNRSFLTRSSHAPHLLNPCHTTCYLLKYVTINEKHFSKILKWPKNIQKKKSDIFEMFQSHHRLLQIYKAHLVNSLKH